MGRSFGRAVAAYFEAISQTCPRMLIAKCVGSIPHKVIMRDKAFLESQLVNRPKLTDEEQASWIERKFGNANLPDELRSRVERFSGTLPE